VAAAAIAVLGAGAYFFASQPVGSSAPAADEGPPRTPAQKARAMRRAREQAAKDQRATDSGGASTGVGRATAMTGGDPLAVRPSPPLGEPEKPVRQGMRTYPPIPEPPEDPDVSPAAMLEPVGALFDEAREALDGCYSESFADGSGVGTAVVQFRVDDEGRARPLRVRTTQDLPDGDMIPCVADIVGGFDFSDVPAGTRVSWPLDYGSTGLAD
jgi:hypothetical protein